MLSNCISRSMSLPTLQNQLRCVHFFKLNCFCSASQVFVLATYTDVILVVLFCYLSACVLYRGFLDGISCSTFYTLVFALCAGIVLMPGDTLPLKVVRRQDRAKLEAALSAPAPYTRLIAVVGTSHLNVHKTLCSKCTLNTQLLFLLMPACHDAICCALSNLLKRTAALHFVTHFQQGVWTLQPVCTRSCVSGSALAYMLLQSIVLYLHGVIILGKINCHKRCAYTSELNALLGLHVL